MDSDPEARLRSEVERRVGTTLDGKYELKQLLGFGATGAVYEGWNPLVGRSFAIKVLHRQYQSHREIAERFRREALAANRVRVGSETHPNVVDVVDVGRAVGSEPAYLVQPLLRGETLEARLARAIDNQLSLDEAATILRPVLNAIATAHDAGIVHRDLKPANIFLVDPGRGEVIPKVMDFGIAQFSDARITDGHSVLGTPLYMAPECFTMPHAVDCRVDVWALGAILYEMLEGVPPFAADGSNWIAMGDVILSQPPRPMRNALAEAQQQWMTTSLAKDRDRRFADGRRQLDAFETAFPS